MVAVYFDTSALVKLLVQEDGSQLAVRLWDGADAVITHPCADYELATVLAAAVRTDRLSAGDSDSAFRTWESYRGAIRWARPPADPAWFREVAMRHVLRGNDLVHLQSALMLERAGRDEQTSGMQTSGDREPSQTDPRVVMAVWDPQLARAAEAEGLMVVPRLEAGLGASG